jgi:putative ABC transport system permease protein
MDTLLRDLRFGLRMLFKQPGFFVVAVLTLALGIGANSAIFSFVKVAILDALPYHNAERLVMVWQDYRHRGGPEREWFSYPNFVDYRTQSRTLEDMAVFDAGKFVLTGTGEPEAVSGELVSPSFFSVLGVQIPQGRSFLREEANPGSAPVAVVSHGLWKRRYSGDPEIVGKKIVIDDKPYTVVGVLPEDFFAPLVPDAAVFLPMPTPNVGPGSRTDLTLRAVGRVKQGITLSQARADLATVARRIVESNADADRDVGATVYPLREETMGKARPALLALFGAVALVLLIACVNVANLLLARAIRRRGEIGLRIALGAEPKRLTRQMLTESLLLAFIGGSLGMLLAGVGMDLLKRLAISASFPLPRLESVRVDAGVSSFTLVTVIATGLLFGLVPAIEIRRSDITRVLQGITGGRSTAGKTGRLLVVFEIALAIVLLVGAGLMLHSFERLQRVNTGYNASELLVLQLQTPKTRYKESHDVKAFYANLLSRIKSLPGVVSAGAVSSLPMGGSNTDTVFHIEGRPQTQQVTLWYRIITPDYFKTSGLALRQGRGIEERDQEEAPRAIVINESAAKQYFPGQNPVGQALLTSSNRYAIVGVAQNGRSFSLKTEEPPAIYLAHGQVPTRNMGIVVRTKGDPRQLAKPVRTVLSSLDPAMAAIELKPFGEMVTASVAPERAVGILVGTFGLLALLLAGVGLYGLIAYLTAQRTREIGIRMALGAGNLSVAQLVLREALTLSTTGMVLGLLAALALTRVLKSMLFEVSALDPLSFVASAVVLTAIALFASYLPVRRAVRLDPALVMRS